MNKEKIKLLLIGDLSGKSDEGVRNITENLYDHLKSKYLVCIIKPSKFKHLIEIRKFNPDIIHALRGPSFKTLFLLKILSLICRPKKILCSLLHPSNSVFNSKFIIRFFKSFIFCLKIKI